MKTYIKPSITVAILNTGMLLAGSNGVKSLSGLGDDVSLGGDFEGGEADSRSGGWFDDED